MRKNDFVVGKAYSIVTKDWETPLGDTVLGKAMTIEVLSPAGVGGGHIVRRVREVFGLAF